MLAALITPNHDLDPLRPASEYTHVHLVCVSVCVSRRWPAAVVVVRAGALDVEKAGRTAGDAGRLGEAGEGQGGDVARAVKPRGQASEVFGLIGPVTVIRMAMAAPELDDRLVL